MIFQPIGGRVIAELYYEKKNLRKNLNQKQLKNLLFATVTLFGFTGFQIRRNRQINLSFQTSGLNSLDFQGVLMKLLIL